MIISELDYLEEALESITIRGGAAKVITKRIKKIILEPLSESSEISLDLGLEPTSLDVSSGGISEMSVDASASTSITGTF
ncbi:MAG: hypothetical protein ACRC2R_13015 [Xenococcaceae cyanobacterium]